MEKGLHSYYFNIKGFDVNFHYFLIHVHWLFNFTNTQSSFILSKLIIAETKP